MNPQYDTPPGVPGQINQTGQVTTGPLAGTQAGTNTNAGYVPPTPISASNLGTSTKPIAITPSAPPAPTDLNALATHLITNYPTPTTQEASAQGDLSSLIQKINDATGTLGTQSAEQNKLNAAPGGVDALNSQLNELNKQITGLNNNAFAAQQTSEGRQAPMFAINGEQAQIDRQKAVQMYALSAASSALQGDLSLAQQKVQHALAAEFDPIKTQIQQYQNLLTLAHDNLTTAQQEKSTMFQAQLKQLDTQITQQQSNKSTAMALALSALKNNPGNQAAQLAYNQVLKLSPSDPQYMEKAYAAVGQYQNDPIATQKALADLGLIQAQTAKARADASTASVANQVNNTDIVSLISSIKNPNETRSELGGLTLNGLNQKAQAYLTNGGNIQGLGLSGKGNVAIQRGMIANYGGYLADKMGMTVPEITAAYKANAKAASTIITRTAKIETVAATLTSQFPRLQQLADKVGNLGIQESDLTAAKAAAFRKLGNVDAANYIELVQTVRQDYSSMQASIAGSQGASYFSESADKAIPLGLTADQYAGIAQTIAGSASLAQKAGGDEANKLIMGANSPSAGGTTLMTGPDGKDYNVPNEKVDAFTTAGGKKK